MRSLAGIAMGATVPGAGEKREDPTMESWRQVWRDGFVPVISTNGLEALRARLRATIPGSRKAVRRLHRR